MSTTRRPRLGVLLGDPAGVGPEMGVKLLADAANARAAELLLIAAPSVLAGGERIAKARHVHVTNGHGSDLAMDKAERPSAVQYGMADEPGRWDHWATGLVCTTPVEESVEGTLVIPPASIVFPFERYTTEPITIRFSGGMAEAIEGGREAVMLRDLLATQTNQNCRRVAHVGWGVEHRARWDMLAIRGWDNAGGVESRSVYGNVLIALGENRDLGGQNAAPLHIDISLRDTAIALDGEPVADSGRILDPALA